MLFLDEFPFYLLSHMIAVRLLASLSPFSLSAGPAGGTAPPGLSGVPGILLSADRKQNRQPHIQE